MPARVVRSCAEGTSTRVVFQFCNICYLRGNCTAVELLLTLRPGNAAMSRESETVAVTTAMLDNITNRLVSEWITM